MHLQHRQHPKLQLMQVKLGSVQSSRTSRDSVALEMSRNFVYQGDVALPRLNHPLSVSRLDVQGIVRRRAAFFRELIGMSYLGKGDTKSEILPYLSNSRLHLNLI